MNPFLEAALDAARRGFRVFPLIPRLKNPMIKGWKDEATWNEAKIRKWWAKWPDANIGIACGRMRDGRYNSAVDFDCKAGKSGMASLEMMDTLSLTPRTARVRTQSGGAHLIYIVPESADLSISANRIEGFPDVDLRGFNGLIVGPGSVFEGKTYTWEDDVPIAEAPADLVDLLKSSVGRARKFESKEPVGEVDSNEAVSRSIDWLSNDAPMAVQNDGGNDTTFRVAAKVKDFGVSQSTALELMGQFWNEAEKALPPWSPEELQTIIGNAFSYGQNPPGVAQAAAEFDRVPPDAADLIELTVASSFAHLPKPHREFLVPRADLFHKRNVHILNGDGGTGKSLLALQLSVAVVAGTQFLGLDVEKGPVIYLSAEDDEDETHIRLKDICLGEGVDLARLNGLHIALMAGKDAVLATEDVKTAKMQKTLFFRKLEASLDYIRPSLLVLDNLADIFAGNENVRSLVKQFVGLLRGLALKYDCTILILAHPSLSGISNGSGSSGSTAWNNSVRSRTYLKRQSDDPQEITDVNFRRLVTMKSNYSATGTEIGMRWEAGLFVSTDMRELDENGCSLEEPTEKAERVYLKLLKRFEAEGRPPSTSPSPTYAPTLFEKSDSEGVTSRRFEVAQDRLLKEGRIVIVEEGPPSKRRRRFRMAENSGLPTASNSDAESVK